MDGGEGGGGVGSGMKRDKSDGVFLVTGKEREKVCLWGVGGGRGRHTEVSLQANKSLVI